MININEHILQALENSITKLSDEAVTLIKQFIISQMDDDGGFIDRNGNPDLYYSVFGYSLAYIFEIPIDIEKHRQYLINSAENNKLDFVHTISLLRCHLILTAIKYKLDNNLFSRKIEKITFLKDQYIKKVITNFKNEFSHLFSIVEKYKTVEGGYNHFAQNEKYATTYANFLALGLFTDISLKEIQINQLYISIKHLEKENGAFVNEVSSSNGVTSSTSAGIIIKYLAEENVEKNLTWLKNKQNEFGGFSAAENISLLDLLSTATALSALTICNSSPLFPGSICEDFVISHLDDCGGFFGSLADMQCDCEYTYYALLALGLA